MTEREGCHVIVAVTDGGDTTSYKRYDMRWRQRSGRCSAVSNRRRADSRRSRPQHGRRACARALRRPPAADFYPESFEQLDAAFADIIRELRTQYLFVVSESSSGRAAALSSGFGFHP